MNPAQIVLFHHFRRFLESAAEARIDVAPLKGAHLVTAVYPAGEERGPMADVDFLVRPGDFDRAGALLEKLGFRRRTAPGRPVTDREFYEATYDLELPGGRGIALEPHRYLIQPARHPVDYEALWSRSVASTFDGVPCRRLAPEDHLLHTAIHLLHHAFVDARRGLRDIEWLLRRGGADLGAAIERARTWECSRALWLALSLLHLQAPELAVDRPAEAIEPGAPVRAALTLLVPGPEGLRFAGSGTRPAQLMLYPLLLDGPGPLARFLRYYAGLRLRDAAALARARVGA